ncbi:TetR/AcrR family transcriptional regulator [Isoptericola jiangsuensis]|nr:TetR/AcrR family transcriptional regulator [Isoptericola jiangsuensis]
MSTDPTDLTMQRLWGRQPRPRRGPKPALSAERIVETAFELAEADGLDAVSMARVAETLGCSPMALYRHVSSKDELLVLLTDRVAALLPDLTPGLGWRAGLERWTRLQIELVVAHPWYLDLPLATALPGPHRLRWFDQALEALSGVPLPFDEKLGILGLLAQHVLGEAQVQVDTRRAAVATVRATTGVAPDVPDADLDPDAVDRANLYYDFEKLLTSLATPEHYPHLFAAAAAWDPQDAPPASPTDDIAFGIGVVLDGIEVYLRRRTGGAVDSPVPAPADPDRPPTT